MMMNNMLKVRGHEMEGKSAVISGSGNVATYAAQKILQLGGKVTLSDSSGFIHAENGINRTTGMGHGPQDRSARQNQEAADEFGWKFVEGERPWGSVRHRVTCATQMSCKKTMPKCDRQRLYGCSRRCQHAVDHSSCSCVQGARMLFALQSGKRRWCCRFRLGNESEQRAYNVERRTRAAPATSWRAFITAVVNTALLMMTTLTTPMAQTLPASSRSPMR